MITKTIGWRSNICFVLNKTWIEICVASSFMGLLAYTQHWMNVSILFKVLNYSCGCGCGCIVVAGDVDAILRIAVAAAMIFFKVAQNTQ